MEPKTQLVLDERDLRMVDLLVELGLSRNPAKVLVFLLQVDEAVSQEIEQGASMRQPEVSVAVRELRRRGWVAKRDIPTEGKGRPMHGYRLDASFADVLDTFEETIRERAERALDRVDELRTMAADVGASEGSGG